MHMDRLLSALATTGVASTGLYLLTLGATALLRPELAKGFLGGFVSSAATHMLELTLRILAGAALVSAAPRMPATLVLSTFGWVLIATSVVLLILPWKWHQQFAASSVPRAMPYLTFIGIASTAAGAALLAALWLARAPA